MNIITTPTQVSGPTIGMALSDEGSAHVSFTIFIAGVTPTPIQWDETFMGTRTFVLPMAPGTYKCDMMIGAFVTNNALGPVYKSEIRVNGQLIASAKGKVPKKQNSDFDFKTETITVV